MESKEKKSSKYVELMPFIIENINNGDLVSQVNEAISRLTKDITGRPNVRKPRKIIVELVLDPPAQDDPQQIAGFSYLVKEQIPAHRGFKGTAALRDGVLQLHEFPTENVNQMTIPLRPAAAGS